MISSRLLSCFSLNLSGGRAIYFRGSSVSAPHQPERSLPLKRAVNPGGGLSAALDAINPRLRSNWIDSVAGIQRDEALIMRLWLRETPPFRNLEITTYPIPVGPVP